MKQQYNIRIDSDLLDRARECAEKNNITVTKLIEDGLDRIICYYIVEETLNQ